MEIDLTCWKYCKHSKTMTLVIGGFGGGAEGRGPPFSKPFSYDPNPSNRPENGFIKYSLILSTKTIMLLHFAPMLYAPSPEKFSFHSRWGGGGGGRSGLGPLFLNFLDPSLLVIFSPNSIC